MPLRLTESPLTFENAMSIHIFHAQKTPTKELAKYFGNHPSAFSDILSGKLHPGSWDAAIFNFTHGYYWNPEITRIIDQRGYLQILSELSAGRPKSMWAQRHLEKIFSKIECYIQQNQSTQ